jgi:hypothetical protein
MNKILFTVVFPISVVRGFKFIIAPGKGVGGAFIPRTSIIRSFCISPDKKNIISLFEKNIKNKEITNIPPGQNEGNWLETQMGIKINSNNAPDIDGYEMKKWASKITLGDYSASEYLFSKEKPTIEAENGEMTPVTKTQFLRWFGKPNPAKNGRYSWAGDCVPKYNIWNFYGQTLTITDKKDIVIYYSFDKDNRPDEWKEGMPDFIKKSPKIPKIIAIWKMEKIKRNIENKFNKQGFFLCKKRGGTYQEIMFGKPFDYDYFTEKIKTNKIVFESGMNENTHRCYSFFRGTVKHFWRELLE